MQVLPWEEGEVCLESVEFSPVFFSPRSHEQRAERADGLAGPGGLWTRPRRWRHGLPGLGAAQLPGAGQLQPPLGPGAVVEEAVPEPGQAEGLQQDVGAALRLRHGWSPRTPTPVCMIVNNARHYTDHLHLAVGNGTVEEEVVFNFLFVCLILLSVLFTPDFLRHRPTFPKSLGTDKDVISKRFSPAERKLPQRSRTSLFLFYLMFCSRPQIWTRTKHEAILKYKYYSPSELI